jgi:hypothetical protein
MISVSDSVTFPNPTRSLSDTVTVSDGRTRADSAGVGVRPGLPADLELGRKSNHTRDFPLNESMQSGKSVPSLSFRSCHRMCPGRRHSPARPAKKRSRHHTRAFFSFPRENAGYCNVHNVRRNCSKNQRYLDDHGLIFSTLHLQLF